jgi:hypothetical protein
MRRRVVGVADKKVWDRGQTREEKRRRRERAIDGRGMRQRGEDSSQVKQEESEYPPSMRLTLELSNRDENCGFL